MRFGPFWPACSSSWLAFSWPSGRGGKSVAPPGVKSWSGVAVSSWRAGRNAFLEAYGRFHGGAVRSSCEWPSDDCFQSVVLFRGFRLVPVVNGL